MPLRKHTAHGGDGGTPDGSPLPPPAGVRVGAVGARATALPHAARPGSTQRGAAHLAAGHCANPICQLSRLGAEPVGKAPRHIGAVAFVHRLDLNLNGYLNFHVRAVDGVPEEVAGDN